MDFLKSASDALFKSLGQKETKDETINEKDIVSFVKNRVEEARQNPSRLAFESGVVTNTAYLLGYDSVYYDSKMKIFRNHAGSTATPMRGRIHRNMILPTVNNRLAKLCKNPPRYEVRPNSAEEEDKQAARLSMKLLENVFDRERYSEKRIEAAMWMQQAGYSWIKVGWDPDKGNRIPYTDEEGNNQIEYEGDIYLDVVSPLEVFVDPLAKNREEMGWLIQAKVRKLTYFRDRYEKGDQVKAETAWLNAVQNQLRINQMNNKSGLTGSEELMKHAAIELAYYEKPSRKYPNGRLIITANGVLLAYKPLPVPEIPFIKFDDIKIGGKFHSESLITHLRPLQDQMNRIQRRKAEFVNKSLGMKILAAKGHGLNEEALTDTTEVVEFNPVPEAPAPQQLNMPELPNYAFAEDENLKVAFDEISGISQPSKGQMPSASIPGIGMQLLVEQDDSRIGIIIESNENSHADVGRLVLQFANRYYKSERIIKESGKAGEYTFTKFTSEDLRNHTDVIVIRGSTLPGSKVLKRQELMNLYQQGLLGDPMDPLVKQKMLEALEFGDLAEVWTELAIDLAQVERSIDMIERGEKPFVHPDDNHQLHFERKNRLRKSDKFKNLPPGVQQLLMLDILAHKAYLAQTPEEAQALLQASQGIMPQEPQEISPEGPIPGESQVEQGGVAQGLDQGEPASQQMPLMSESEPGGPSGLQ